MGPLFELEWSRGNLRGRLDLLRVIYCLGLIVEVFALAQGEEPTTPEFAQGWLIFFVAQQLLLIVVTTPAFVAAGIGDEKARGSLQFLLLTDLSSWEIVAGTCLGRLSQTAALLSAGLPLLCFLAAFGGFPLTTPICIAAFTLAFLFALSGASALAAVWARQTRDAVLALYMVAAGLLFSG